MRKSRNRKLINIVIGVLIIIVLYAVAMYLLKDKGNTVKESESSANSKIEKSIIGKIKYLDCYMYFDSTGVVVKSEVSQESTKEENTKEEDTQSSTQKTGLEENQTGQVQDLAPTTDDELSTDANGQDIIIPVEDDKMQNVPPEETVVEIPCIEGLEVAYVRLNEKLPVKNKKVFNTILALNRMIQKSNAVPDRIVFDKEENISLYYGMVVVNLGKDNLLEEKVIRMVAILPNITGMDGTLHLEDFTKETKNIIFEKKVEEPESDASTGTADGNVEDGNAEGGNVEDGNTEDGNTEDGNVEDGNAEG